MAPTPGPAAQVARRRDALATEYADEIRPLVPLASRAYGTLGPDSPERRASDLYNRLLLEYTAKGGNVRLLADRLGVAYVTLSRRLRVARSNTRLGVSTRTGPRPTTSRDPELIEFYAREIREARDANPTDRERYHTAVRSAYNDGVSLYAVAEALEMSYYALYSVLRSADPSAAA